MLLALLSAVVLGGVQEASCAMHGLGAARGDGVATAGVVHAVHASAMAHAGGEGSQNADHPGCDCTCIGDCSMVAPLATPPSVATLRVALSDPAPRRPLDIEPALPVPSEPDGLLPFANGPPASPLV
jgi:hypothetical protein